MRDAKSFKKMLKSPDVKVWYTNSPIGCASLAQSTAAAPAADCPFFLFFLTREEVRKRSAF